jgi:hypothetical protein
MYTGYPSRYGLDCFNYILIQPVSAVDGPVNQNFGYVMELSLAMIIKLSAVIILTPIFLFPGAVVATLGAWCGQIYIKAQLSVKREMSNARSPVLGHFGAAISGLGWAVISFHGRIFDDL